MSKTNESQLNLMLKHYLGVHEFNVNQEVEVKFGTKGFRQLTRSDFENVIKKLKSSGFTDMPVSNMLRIQSEFLDERKGSFTLSNVRTEITGTTQIQKYCHTNSVVDDNMEPMRNVSFVQKSIKKVDKQPKSHLGQTIILLLI